MSGQKKIAALPISPTMAPGAHLRRTLAQFEAERQLLEGYKLGITPTSSDSLRDRPQDFMVTPDPIITEPTSPEKFEAHPYVDLIAHIGAIDTSAFEQLYNRVYNYAFYTTQNAEDAEEITLDVFVKALQNPRQFEDISDFSAWLFRIARNKRLMWLRERKISPPIALGQNLETEEGSIPRDFTKSRPNPEQISCQSELGDILRTEPGTTEQRFTNYRELIDRVVDVFGDEIAASKWLSTPNADFEQKAPIDVAREHEYDMTALEPVLIRIEHGVYF